MLLLQWLQSTATPVTQQTNSRTPCDTVTQSNIHRRTYWPFRPDPAGGGRRVRLRCEQYSGSDRRSIRNIHYHSQAHSLHCDYLIYRHDAWTGNVVYSCVVLIKIKCFLYCYFYPFDDLYSSLLRDITGCSLPVQSVFKRGCRLGVGGTGQNRLGPHFSQGLQISGKMQKHSWIPIHCWISYWVWIIKLWKAHHQYVLSYKCLAVDVIVRSMFSNAKSEILNSSEFVECWAWV